MTEQRYRHYFEADVPRCIHDYGTAPCQAALGVTGTKKCYKYADGCQDPANFSAETQVIRFVTADDFDADREAGSIPMLKDISIRPQRLEIGESSGSRERGTATFVNGQSNDSLFDPYPADRAINAWNSGSFWGKMESRIPSFAGYECRHMFGTIGAGEAFTNATSDVNLDFGVQSPQNVLGDGVATMTNTDSGDSGDCAIILTVDGHVDRVTIANHTLGGIGLFYSWQVGGSGGWEIIKPFTQVITNANITDILEIPVVTGQQLRLLLSVPASASVTIGRITGSGLDISNVRVGHYIIEESSRTKNGFKIEFCDALKSLDSDRALFPFPSNGVLAANIGTSTTPFTLEPAGVGSSLNPDGSQMYPTPGHASIGDEFISYTRSGDVITPTGRGLRGTEASDHEANDTLQFCYAAEAEVLSVILNDIISATPLPSAYRDLPGWQQNVDSFNPFRYTGFIGEPTAARKLIDEIVRDAGLIAGTDIARRKVFFKQIRHMAPSFSYSERGMINQQKATLTKKRVSANYVRYARLSPLEKMDAEKNYRGRVFTVSADPLDAIRNNTPVIADHFSRWISNRVSAEYVSDIVLALRRKAPQELSFTVPSLGAPNIGDVGLIQSWRFEDDEGLPAPAVPMIVVEANHLPGKSEIVCVEYRPAQVAPGDVVNDVPLERDALNMSTEARDFATLRDIWDFMYTSAPPANSTVRFVASDGVVFGSSSTSEFAVIMGDWPEVVNDGVTLQIVGLFMPGAGGAGGQPGFNGQDGGPALYTRVNVELIGCTVGGGGGGGAGAIFTDSFGNTYFAQGGGGAGRNPGTGFNSGTLTNGGQGEDNDDQAVAGNGGSLGQNGGDSNITGGAVGGTAGIAIDGASFVTLTNSTVLGAQVNS